MAMDVCKKYYEWAKSEELTGNADKATGEVYAEKLDALVNEHRAFKTVTVEGVVTPVSTELQQRFIRAADYSDRWMHNLETGEILQAYYLCMGGDSTAPWDYAANGGKGDWKFKDGGGRTDKCEALTLAKDWRMLLTEDPMSAGQKWYCPCCGARYKTSYGLIMEMLVAEEDGLSHKLLYSRVKFPDTRGLDLKALCIQFGKDKPLPAGQQAAAAATEYTTPEELFQALPKRRPLGEGQSLVEVEGKDGTFRPNNFAWSSFEMEEASLYFTTILSKQHRKILKTNFEELQKKIEEKAAAQEAKGDEVMAADWEDGGLFRG